MRLCIYCYGTAAALKSFLYGDDEQYGKLMDFYVINMMKSIRIHILVYYILHILIYILYCMICIVPHTNAKTHHRN